MGMDSTHVSQCSIDLCQLFIALRFNSLEDNGFVPCTSFVPTLQRSELVGPPNSLTLWVGKAEHGFGNRILDLTGKVGVGGGAAFGGYATLIGLCGVSVAASTSSHSQPRVKLGQSQNGQHVQVELRRFALRQRIPGSVSNGG
jgi:hypothetical protein